MVAGMDPIPIETAITGGLLGVAAGDALGTTVEHMAPEEIRRRLGVHREIVGGGPFGRRPGQGTDDTDLTWAVVAGYLETGGGDSLECLDGIARAFLEWFDTAPSSIGHTTFRALSELRAGGDPTASGLAAESSCGNGSLMRALPTALIRADPGRRRRESELISAVTHAHRRCTDSCVAYNEIAAALINGAAAPAAIAAGGRPRPGPGGRRRLGDASRSARRRTEHQRLRDRQPGLRGLGRPAARNPGVGLGGPGEPGR